MNRFRFAVVSYVNESNGYFACRQCVHSLHETAEDARDAIMWCRLDPLLHYILDLKTQMLVENGAMEISAGSGVLKNRRDREGVAIGERTG